MGPNSLMVDNLNRTCEGKIVIIEYLDDFINGSFLFRKNTKIFILLYNMYKWEVFITVKASNIFCTLGKSMFFSVLVTKEDVETPKNISCVQEWRRLVVGGRICRPSPKTKGGRSFLHFYFQSSKCPPQK